MGLSCFHSLRSFQQDNPIESSNSTCYPCVRTLATLGSGPNTKPALRYWGFVALNPTPAGTVVPVAKLVLPCRHRS